MRPSASGRISSVRVKEPITILIPKELAKASAIKEYFEKRLRASGFNVTGAIVSWDDLMVQYNAKTMQAFLMSMNADYPDTEFLARNFESTNPDNFSGLKSRSLDLLIKKARETESRNERATLYGKIAQTLNDEATTVNLLHYRAHYWFPPVIRPTDLPENLYLHLPHIGL